MLSQAQRRNTMTPDRNGMPTWMFVLLVLAAALSAAG